MSAPQTQTEHSAAAVIKWLRTCKTHSQLRRLWGELTPYSKNLLGVVAAKDRLKGKLK